MAKRSLAMFRPSAPAPVVVMAPSRGGKIRRAAKRAGGLARGAGRRVARGARSHAVPAIPMAIGGAIVGALDAKGFFNKLPAIGGSRALTLALAGYAATRFIKNPTIRNAGLAAMAVGAFDAVKAHVSAGARPAVVPPAKGTSGHDDDSGNQGDGGPY
jgi:hypothetical protein